MKIVCFFLLIFSVSVNAKTFDLHKIPTRLSFNVQLIKMPHGEKNMGLFGLNYLVDFKPWFYAGIGGYGSIAGKRGGLFVLGVDAGLRHEIIGNLVADAGIYVGGGGGGVAMVGGGLMWRPYLNLLYDFNYFRLGVGYSEVHFPTGDIDSRQVTGVIEIPINFYSAAPNYSAIVFKDFRNIVFENSYISALAQIYFQKKGIINTHNKVNDSPIKLVGIEVGHFITKHSFVYLKSAGALGGNENGYMDILSGIGYRLVLPMLPRFAVLPAVAVGAGGGGTISTGGGLLAEPRVGLQYKLSSSIGLGITGGYLFAPFGNFRSFSLTGSLTYSLMFASMVKQVNQLFKPSNLMWHNWRVRIMQQTYIKPQRNNNIKNNLQLIAIQFDSLINNYFYLTGQATSAYAGKAGGYASGMFGVGLQSKSIFDNRLSFNVEMLGGAAGGGGIAVAGGALLEPAVGATLHLNKYFGFHFSTGKIFALRSKLNAFTFNAGLQFTFATLNAE